jgi:rhodanese-related sulfurtransferase
MLQLFRCFSSSQVEGKEFGSFCNLGWRSALAADIAQQMGLQTCHIDGGFEASKVAGGEGAEGRK